MTTKFSRNRARVQPTPKVCKSPKRLPPAPGPYPATISGGGNWNVAYLMFNFSTLNTGATLTQTTPGVYVGTMLDVQGRTWTMTVNITVGATATCTFSCPTFGPAGNDFTGTDGVYLGVRPFVKTVQPLAPAPMILGSASWSLSVV